MASCDDVPSLPAELVFNLLFELHMSTDLHCECVKTPVMCCIHAADSQYFLLCAAYMLLKVSVACCVLRTCC